MSFSVGTVGMGTWGGCFGRALEGGEDSALRPYSSLWQEACYHPHLTEEKTVAQAG